MLHEKNKIDHLLAQLKTAINEMYKVFTNDILILDNDTRATLICIDLKELIKMSEINFNVNFKFKSEEYSKNDKVIFDESNVLIKVTISEDTLNGKKMVMLLIFAEETENTNENKQNVLEKLKSFTKQSGEHQFEIGAYCELHKNNAHLTYCIDGDVVLF